MTRRGIGTYWPNEQLRVLKAVNEQCGILGQRVAKEDLIVPNMNGYLISDYCGILTKLEFITSSSFEEDDGPLFYPVSITVKGQLMVDEANKRFWEYAQDAAIAGVKALTGVDLEKFAKFFRSAYDKYQLERT